MNPSPRSLPYFLRIFALISALILSISSSFGTVKSFSGDNNEAVDTYDMGNGETMLFIDMNDGQEPIIVTIPTPDVLEDRVKEIMGWDLIIEDAFFNIIDVDASGNLIGSPDSYGTDLSLYGSEVGFAFIEINGDIHFAGHIGNRYIGDISDNNGLSNMLDFATVLDGILGTGLGDMVSDLTAFGMQKFETAFMEATNNLADDFSEYYEENHFFEMDGDDSDWSDQDFEDFINGGGDDFWDWLMGLGDDHTADPWNGN